MRRSKLARTFRLLRVELGRLRRLYDVSTYAFTETGELLTRQLGSSPEAMTAKIMIPNTERVVAYSPGELIERMKSTYPEMLRASLLVRAVSQMENYLVDLLSEIAERSLEPFKQQDKIISMPQA